MLEAGSAGRTLHCSRGNEEDCCYEGCLKHEQQEGLCSAHEARTKRRRGATMRDVSNLQYREEFALHLGQRQNNAAERYA